MKHRLLLLLPVLYWLCATKASAGFLPLCKYAAAPGKNETFGPASGGSMNETTAAADLRNSTSKTIGQDLKKSCLTMMETKSDEANHFYVAQEGESLLLESEMCGEDEAEISETVDKVDWVVALRKENKHLPLFSFPPVTASAKWLQGARHEVAKTQLKWVNVRDIENSTVYFCLTRTGQLHVKQFKPDLAGTYMANIDKSISGMLRLRMRQFLSKTFHHLDYVYDSHEFFEKEKVRQHPDMAPKVSKARAFGAEKNLRWRFRTPEKQPSASKMETAEGTVAPGSTKKKHLYPSRLFWNLGLSMMWTPPPELRSFTDWKPSCGMKIFRDRYMRCMLEVDLVKLDTRLGLFKPNKKLKKNYRASIKGGVYNDAHGLSILFLLHGLTKRLQVQLLDESRETPDRRPLYSAGLRWTEKATTKMGQIELRKVLIPCHYTLLHHMPNSFPIHTDGASTASVFVPSIGNRGEREEAVRLCGLSDPMDLLRMMGEMLVSELKKLVKLSLRKRPTMTQRSIVFSGKTVYIKCPVDFSTHEKPVCNLADRENNILWTLNSKTMRFFPTEADRGPSITDECALVVKQIGFNDAGQYECFRTVKGARSVEETPAYRHDIEVVRPDFDPPTIEEVYFGLAVCLAWLGCLMVLWSAVSVLRGLLGLLSHDTEGRDGPEEWTSFYDNDESAAADTEDEEDDESEDDESEDGEESKEDKKDEEEKKEKGDKEKKS